VHFRRCSAQVLFLIRSALCPLSQYKRAKQKGVMMASRSLIALYRDINPAMLAKKDRGKTAALGELQ